MTNQPEPMKPLCRGCKAGRHDACQWKWNVVAENDVTDDIMNIIASRMPKDVVSKPVEEVETVQQMDDDIEDMNDDEYDEMVSK